MAPTLTLTPDPTLWLLAALFVGCMYGIVFFSFLLIRVRQGSLD